MASDATVIQLLPPSVVLSTTPFALRCAPMTQPVSESMNETAQSCVPEGIWDPAVGPAEALADAVGDGVDVSPVVGTACADGASFVEHAHKTATRRISRRLTS